MEEFTDGVAAAAGHFPKDLMRFFEAAPRVLLIKGKPRVGKTLFVLGLAEALGPPINSFMINTRELEPRNYEAFAWLSTNEARDKALDSMPAAEAQPKPEQEMPHPPEAEAKLKSARDLLKSILGEEAAPPPPAIEKKASPQNHSQASSGSQDASDLPGLRKALGNKNPRELMRVLRGLEAMGPGKAVVMVNRVDRLGEKYDVPVRPLVLAIKSDMVLGRKAHLVLVLDKPSTVIDDLADGIVNLKDVSHGDEFLGQLEINKLADTPFKQSKWMYNTMTGKFQILKGISTV